MTTFYSDYQCTKCNNTEKILVDYNDGHTHLVMPGQPSLVNDICETTCPFCNAKTTSNIISRKGLFVGVADTSYLCIKIDELTYEETLEKWKNEKRSLYIFDENFANHPYSPSDLIKLDGHNYKVQQTFIREWIEADPDVRLENAKTHAYCYALTDEKGEQCWLQVEQGHLDNAFLNYKEGFVLRDENDVILDISDDTSYPLEIFKSDWVDSLELCVLQFKSGYEFKVTNEKNETTFNGFYTSFEEGFEEFEANITLSL